MQNILLDLVGKTQDLAGDLTAAIAQKLYSITGLDDPYIIVGISTAFIVVPIMWFFVDNFTETIDYKKAAGLVLALVVFTIGEKKDYIDYTSYLDQTAHTAGIIGLSVSVVLSILLIMQDPYYQGLFGRFRDD